MFIKIIRKDFLDVFKSNSNYFFNMQNVRFCLIDFDARDFIINLKNRYQRVNFDLRLNNNRYIIRIYNCFQLHVFHFNFRYD